MSTPHGISCRVDGLSDLTVELGSFPGTPGIWGALSHLSSGEATLAHPNVVEARALGRADLSEGPCALY